MIIDLIINIFLKKNIFFIMMGSATGPTPWNKSQNWSPIVPKSCQFEICSDYGGSYDLGMIGWIIYSLLTTFVPNNINFVDPTLDNLHQL